MDMVVWDVLVHHIVTFCGGERCEFYGVPVESITLCYSPDDVRCPAYSATCGCGPSPKVGYVGTSCYGYYDYEERYTTLCWSCNNSYFCQSCYKRVATPTPSPTPTATIVPTALISDEIEQLLALHC